MADNINNRRVSSFQLKSVYLEAENEPPIRLNEAKQYASTLQTDKTDRTDRQDNGPIA